MAGAAESGPDPHDLGRFVDAQAGDYEQALAEIRSGRKRSHWMWYVFPQIDGLGFSSMSRRYSSSPSTRPGRISITPCWGHDWSSAPRRRWG
jgi:hypothetical protein